MTAPPGHVPTIDYDRPPVSGGDAHLALLIREARAEFPELRAFGKRALLAMAREFAAAREADEREKAAHAEAVAAGGFADVRAVVLEEFRAWFTRRGDVIPMQSKAVAHDPRRSNWRTAS